ncbi:MAG: DUF416 family protein [Chitinophagaceae bacterium]
MTPLDINSLNSLEFKKQLIFAYLTCERLYPNYVYFSANFQFGDSSVLRTAIDFVLGCILNEGIDKPLAKKFLLTVEKNTPDTEDFDTILVSSALDACTSIAETLDFLIDKQESRLKDISTVATDSVDMYIQELESLDFNADKDFQTKIDSHPLMQREVAIQTGIINYLSSRKSIDLEDINTLLSLQENNGKGNLGL